VALNRELASSNAEADRAHAFDPTPRGMTSVGLGAGWSKERSLFRQPEAPFKHLHALYLRVVGVVAANRDPSAAARTDLLGGVVDGAGPSERGWASAGRGR
jgi:hypothetical protein